LEEPQTAIRDLLVMKAYLVEARLGYELQAETADEALRLVSLMLPDDRAVSIEYSVRERPEPIAPKEPQPADLHGLTKPVYTVSETASLLGTSRHSVYELVRRGLGCIRMGRRVLIPRSKIIGILNGEVLLEQQSSPAPVRSTTRRHDLRPKKSTSPEVAIPVQRPRSKKEIKEKAPVSVSEAARILHVSTSRLRELLDERRIYYTEYYGKRTIAKKAIENSVNGLPAITMLEENIAYYRANNQMDAEMEEIAAKLLAEWRSEPS
jgi:excisionase family DNA binding protein